MMGDNPSSFTSLTDSKLYDQISPGRRRVDGPLASSSTTSPSLRKSPLRTFNTPRSPQKPITIFDQVVTWFNAEIEVRKRLAGLVCGYFATLSYIITVSLLKITLWAPFSSVRDSLTWWIYPSSWLSIIFIQVISSAISFSHIQQFFKVTQLHRIPITDVHGWAGASLEFVHRLIFLYTAFTVSDCSFRKDFGWIAISFSAAISSAIVIFRSDFHLRFSEIQVTSLKTLIAFTKSLPIDHLFETCGFEAAMSFFSGMALILLIGPVVWGFSAWWLIISVPFTIILFGVNFIQHATAKIFVKTVNQIVMKPMAFPFPPSYSVHSPTPEQTRTLPKVIETADPLLRIFALYDLRTIAWTDTARRAEVFSLSQPGKHPRNWKSVSTPCVNMLDELRSKMTVAAARLVGYTWDDHDAESEAVPPREALMMPRKMREMTYRGAGQSRQQRNIAPIRTLNTQTIGILGKISRFIGHTTEKLVISRYDAQMNAYAAEALYMLVVDSLEEDRYGVVQKDLVDLIILLCKLITAIDTYERAKAVITLCIFIIVRMVNDQVAEDETTKKKLRGFE
uniref:Nucleoporin protein Ndc1-Nup n=1 Tax=Caenorhabditis tropicalis TaxID=1561998 RepID=A0A1I7T5F6_9PELO